MKLILVRHGETVWNAENRVQGFSDIDLNETGRRQARLTARALACEHITAVYASPLKRAHDTAREIAARHNLEVHCDSALMEMNQGEMEGITIKEMRERYGEFLQAWRYNRGSLPMPGGESIAQVYERTRGLMAEIKTAHRDGSVVVVSHSFTLFAILCGELHIDYNNFGNMQLKSCGISVLDCNGSHSCLTLLNHTCHLQD